MYYVYILQSNHGKGFYTGLTNNISRRLYEHNAGQVKSTKNRAPFALVHVEKFTDRQSAREREKFFKSGHGREFWNQILNKNIPA